MIGHVINLFPGEKDFIFICNKNHLKNDDFKMYEIIKNYCPSGQIIGIEPHKLGPVHAVLAIKNLINNEEEIIVNYCDFSCYWDWNNFKDFIFRSSCDGAIPSYKGFHPHSLGTTNYAYIKEKNMWLNDIQEKKPFTDNRINEYASSGTYYFSKGKLLIDSFTSLIQNNISINGEFYVSLAFKELLKKSKNIAIYPLQHFFQWGTPEDLEEYKFWSNTFSSFLEKKDNSFLNKGSIIIPMAGMGKRFSDEGYVTPKPLINVSNKPMILKAIEDLPNCKNKVFVMRKDMSGSKKISELISKTYPNSKIKFLENPTNGQAITTMLGLEAIKDENDIFPLTIGACDNGCIYNRDKFEELLSNKEVDVIVWSTRNHANAKRKPKMFGWIDADENQKIKEIAVKKLIDNDLSKQIVIGTFTFKKEGHLNNSINRLIKRKEKVNNEFYLDSCINDAISLGYNCYAFEVDSFISWGTPNDLKTFEYWQSAFHKWKYHKYSLKKDRTINGEEINNLERKYQKILPFFIKKNANY